MESRGPSEYRVFSISAPSCADLPTPQTFHASIRLLQCRIAFNHPAFHAELVITNLVQPYSLLPPSHSSRTYKGPLLLDRLLTPLELPPSRHPPFSVPRPHSAVPLNMSEKRRSGSIDKNSGSDIHEKGLHQDLVGATASPSLPLSYPFAGCPG